jgi:cytochrome c oxidase subunit 3
MRSPEKVKASNRSIWKGGISPLKASYGKLMMWFFLLSDAFTFSGLLITYGLLRYSHQAYEGSVADFVPSQAYWPIPEKIFDAFPFLHGVEIPLGFVGLMTFILIMSSVTMVLAVEAGHRMDKKDVMKWMLWTIVGGIAFLACQAWEWTHFITGSGKEGWGIDLNGDGLLTAADFFGANLTMNEYGPPLFADLFFFITGFHGFHVLSGVVLNVIIFYQASMGTFERRGHYEMVEKVGLYWHFVDLVWVFVFTFFYLI